MTLESENMHVMRRVLEEIWSGRNLDLVPELVDAGYVGHATPHTMTLHGAQQYGERVALYQSLFPEISFTIEDQFASGEKVATRWTARLEHDLETARRDSVTGEPITISGITLCRVQNGKIVEDWDTWDTLTLLESSTQPDILDAMTLSI